MKQLWGNEEVIIRFVTLYGLGLMLFFINWITAYYLLPEGFLRGVGFFGKLAGDKAANFFLFFHISSFFIINYHLIFNNVSFKWSISLIPKIFIKILLYIKIYSTISDICLCKEIHYFLYIS